MPELNQLLELKPLVLLWVSLNFVMWLVKKAPVAPNWVIPFLSPIIGAIAFPFITEPGKVIFSVKCPICLQVFQGFCVGCAAVGTHQAFRSFIERFGFKSDTLTILLFLALSLNSHGATMAAHDTSGLTVPTNAVLQAKQTIEPQLYLGTTTNALLDAHIRNYVWQPGADCRFAFATNIITTTNPVLNITISIYNPTAGDLGVTNAVDTIDGTSWQTAKPGWNYLSFDRLGGRWIGSRQARILSVAATLDFGSTSAQENTDLTVTVTGAVDGDPVLLAVPNASVVAGGCFTAWVSATDEVTVRFNNYSVSAKDPAEGSFKVQITQY